MELVEGPIHNEPNLTVDNRQKYFRAMEKWVIEAYAWEAVAHTVSQMAMCKNFSDFYNADRQNYSGGIPGDFNPTADFQDVPNGGLGPDDEPPFDEPEPGFNRQVNTNIRGVVQGPGPRRQVPALVCLIPPVWKRVMAEFLDFLILFFVKVTITFTAVDYFQFLDLNTAAVLENGGRVNYKMIVSATSQIVTLEIIHRIMVCAYEAYFLRRGKEGEVGGSTPGKALLGLRVLSCTHVVQADNHPEYVVLVYPGMDLGWGLSIARAVVKNIILAVLFPLCFVLLFFKYHRTGYDVVCRTIVVEKVYRGLHAD